MFKKLFENRIHAEANGQLLVNEYEEGLKNLSDKQTEELIVNKIVQVNPATYCCKVCACNISHLINVFDHIKGRRHAVNKSLPKHCARVHHVTKYFCNVCNIDLYCKQNFDEHERGQNHKAKQDSKLCKVDVHKSVSSLKEIASSSNSIGNQSNCGISSPAQFVCFVCDGNFACKEVMAEHLLKSTRDCKISSLIYLKELVDVGLAYHCTLCKVDVAYCVQNLVEHSQGRRHNLSVQEYKEKGESNNLQALSKHLPKSNVEQVQKRLDNLHLVPQSIEEKSKCSYRCYVCNVTVYGDLELLQHLRDLKHKHILSTLPRDYFPFIYCPACKRDIFEDEKMISHLSTAEHKNQLVYSSNKSAFQSDLLHSSPASETIVDELCKQMITRKARKQNADTNKPKKNTFHFNREYGRRFLEIGALNVFNVTDEKVNDLKLGVTLLLQLEEKNLCLACSSKLPKSSQAIFEHLFSTSHIDQVEKLIKDEYQFENFPDQFSDLTLAKEFMKDVNSDVVFCFACNKEIKNDDSIIKKHIDSERNHSVKAQSLRQLNLKLFNSFLDQLCDSWYVVQRFSCQLCNAKFEYEIDFAEHLTEGKKHYGNLKQATKKGMKIGYDVCIPCASICLGTPDTYTKHCDDRMHKYLVKSKDYEVGEMNKLAVNLLNDFDEISESLLRQSDAATATEDQIRLLSKSIERTVASQYPGAKAYIFGSRAAHLAFSDSDVDIFLDCGNAYNGNQLLSKSREYLLNSEACFKNYPNVWEVKEILLKVRAPIIIVHHRESDLNIDLSFTNGLTVEKTKIIKLFISAYPLCRKMILFLKKWSSTCLLMHMQGLTTIGITLLVIFYLQQINVFPSIADLMKKKHKSNVIGDWETGIAQQIPVQPSSLSFKSLLAKFFNFYANYDYRTNVVSPLMGKSLKKLAFIDDRIRELPKEMESYVRYVESTVNAEVFRIDSPFCLQDPIDLAQNITRSVNKVTLRSFKQYCQTSENILNSL